MSDIEFYESGFDGFLNLLESFDMNEVKVAKAMETGAKELVMDVRKLPRPRSKLSAQGYTHLLDTVTYQKKKNEIEVGWGKYYGPMQENGTTRMNGTPHIKPTFKQNRDKYYKTITKELFGAFG